MANSLPLPSLLFLLRDRLPAQTHPTTPPNARMLVAGQTFSLFCWITSFAVLCYALDFTPEMYETELRNMERAAEGSSCWPGLAAGFGAAEGLELLSLENCQRQEGARPFPDVHSERGRGKLQQGNSARIPGINPFAPGWSALAQAVQGGCASPFLEILRTQKDSP